MPKNETKEFRLTRVDHPVRGEAGHLVKPEQRLGYYVRATTAAKALAIMTKRYPGENIELG